MPTYGPNRAYPVGLSPLDLEATVDYIVDWSDWLLPFTDTITTSTWEVPTGITPSDDAIINSSTMTRVWLTVVDATLEGTKVTVVNKIVTAGGRTERRSFEIWIKAK